MKKGLALLAAVFMLAIVMGAACACAESELLTEFEPEWVNAAQYSAEEWFSTKETRALLTNLLTINYSMVEDDTSILNTLAGKTYVTITASGLDLMVIGYIDGVAYMITYHPEEGTAQGLGPLDYTEDDLERVLKSMQLLGEKCEENSADDLVEMLYIMHKVYGGMSKDSE